MVAKEHGDVIKLSNNPYVSINRSAAVELCITLETFGTAHKEEIIHAAGSGRLSTEGCSDKYVTGQPRKCK